MTNKQAPGSGVVESIKEVEDSKETGSTAGTSAQAAPRTPSPAELAWEKETLIPTLAKSAERQKEFTTLSDHIIRRLYTPADLSDWSPERDLGFPGQPPYTRIARTTRKGEFTTDTRRIRRRLQAKAPADRTDDGDQFQVRSPVLAVERRGRNPVLKSGVTTADSNKHALL